MAHNDFNFGFGQQQGLGLRDIIAAEVARARAQDAGGGARRPADLAGLGLQAPGLGANVFQGQGQFGGLGPQVPSSPQDLAAAGLPGSDVGAGGGLGFLGRINEFLGSDKGQSIFDFLKSAGADLAKPQPLAQLQFPATQGPGNANVQDTGLQLLAQLLGRI